MKDKKYSVQNMTKCALFVALISIGAFIKIPIPVLPFTLQFLFTTLAGLLLGGKLGAISVLVYIILGLIGLPVFTEGGGLGYVLKPSFGYIVGFCIGSFITGIIASKVSAPSYIRLFTANIMGLMTVYLCGMTYYYIICNYVINTPIALWPLILYCFILAVPGDIFLCILSTILAKRLMPILNKVQGGFANENNTGY